MHRGTPTVGLQKDLDGIIPASTEKCEGTGGCHQNYDGEVAQQMYQVRRNRAKPKGKYTPTLIATITDCLQRTWSPEQIAHTATIGQISFKTIYRWFDQLLEKRGHKFARYADDCNIYVRTERAAKRVMESCVNFLEGKLKLEVNLRKSRVGSPLKVKFLGFSLHKVVRKIGIRPHGKVLKRFKEKIIEITSRSRGRSIEDILRELRNYTIGWLIYFSIANMRTQMQEINKWIRRRLRMYLWKQWKRISTRFMNLQKLGLDRNMAWQYANTRLGYWRIAGSAILQRTLTDKYLESLGYMNIAKKYEVFHLR